MELRKILFVCSGNTCRSPMAEVMWRALQEGKDSPIEAQSAGVMACPGLPASKEAAEVMREMGLDLSQHKSRALSRDLVEEADLVLTMTQVQKELILGLVPRSEGKVFTLKEFADCGKDDVIDPIGSSLASYRACAHEIKRCLEAIMNKLGS